MVRVQEAVSSNLAALTKLKNNRKSGNSWLPDFYFSKPFLKLKLCFFCIALYA